MPITREHVRHQIELRRVTVSEVRSIVPTIVRVTFAGAELAGFSSPGPADHVKVFFPDPETGVLTTPQIGERGGSSGAGRSGAHAAEGTVISRDYTPLAFRATAEGGELDIDFVLHGDDGPASAWAARAEAGQELAVAGPRGSALVPAGIDRLVIVADETALPAASRWMRAVPDGVEVTALLDVEDGGVHAYLAAQPRRGSLTWLHRGRGNADLESALRALGRFDDRTFLFLAGEATTLIPLRRYLRRELGLPADQVAVSGYWKRGTANLDHHAPVDPSDPD